jgi:IS1 family transposase
MNVLSRADQLGVLNMLVEGTSLRSITRLTGIHRTTIANLMVRVGDQCAALMDRWMRNLTLRHLQIDEIWTFVLKKQSRVPVNVDDKRIGDQYLFIAIDEATKLIPAYRLGKRTKDTTDYFIHDLADRLVLPPSPWGAGPRPQISTDGFPAYPGSIDSAFAGRADHGVLIKNYRNAEQPGRYGPPELIDADRRVVYGGIDENDICTSHVERHNLSIRTFLRRFTRLALGFSKKVENLDAAISLYVAHYNFCRWHGTIRRTPAMAARITGHPWGMEELLTEAESE